MKYTKHLIPIYKPLVYITAIFIILLQSYVIWEDRINAVTFVKYSYATPNGSRTIDRCFIQGRLKYIGDIINTEIKIGDETKQVGVMIESWQIIYADKETIVNWQKNWRSK